MLSRHSQFYRRNALVQSFQASKRTCHQALKELQIVEFEQNAALQFVRLFQSGLNLHISGSAAVRKNFDNKGIPCLCHLSPHCVIPSVISIIQITVTDLYNGLCWQFLHLRDFKPMTRVFSADWVGQEESEHFVIRWHENSNMWTIDGVPLRRN